MTEKPSARAHRIGKAKAIFNTIVADYPPSTAGMERLMEVCATTRNREEGAPCGGVLLNAPTGSGKTMTLKQAAEFAATTAPEGDIPILLVQMPTAGTTDSVPTAILKALGHARPDLGKPEARWLRAVADMRRRGVLIVAFDEFNRANRRPTMSRPIATMIRENIMDAGVAAVAFVGTADAAVVLEGCQEILERLDDEIDLTPLEWHEPEDREILQTFLKEVDEALVDKGLLDQQSGLARKETAKKLCEAAQGRLRPLMGIIRGAMAAALRRDASSIAAEDLRAAVDGYALRFRLVDRNPFA